MAAQEFKRNRGSGPKQSLEALAARRSSIHDRYNERNIDDFLPSAPPLEEAVVAWQNAKNLVMAPSNPSTVTLVGQLHSTSPHTPVNPVNRTNSLRGMNQRPHKLVQKNNYKTEYCGPCQRRIKFGKVCYKCTECRAVAHADCRDALPLPCVSVGSAQKTPGRSMVRGAALADFTPHIAPMVPAIVVHCINELEGRGLGEVGIYRVPGSEREVRELREKFLAGRGCPNLRQVIYFKRGFC